MELKDIPFVLGSFEFVWWVGGMLLLEGLLEHVAGIVQHGGGEPVESQSEAPPHGSIPPTCHDRS